MSSEVLSTSTFSLVVKQIQRLSRSSMLALWVNLLRFPTGHLDSINAASVTKVSLSLTHLGLPLDIVQTLLMWQTLSPSIKQQKFHWKQCGQILVRHWLISSGLTDIVLDYMDRRRVFTVDPAYFPMKRMQEIVSYLH